MKFLVIWKLELSLLSPRVASAVARMPAYARPLEQTGQVAARYHIVGAHGGAWLYDVASNTELERLIALMPIYNFAHYTIYPLAEMPDWDETDGTVTEVRFRGPHTDYHLATPAGTLLIREAGPPRACCGQVCWTLLRARLMPRERPAGHDRGAEP